MTPIGMTITEYTRKYNMFDYTLKGKRIKLIHTDDPYTELKSGDMGTVELVNHSDSGFMESQVFVHWDNGSNLMMLMGKDRFEITEDDKNEN